MKFLNNKYVHLLLLWSVCGVFVSCGNDPIDYQAALEPLTDAGPELTFGTNNTKTVSLQEGDPTTDVISVYRGNTGAEASYSIVVLTNEEDVFTVPETVSFEAGTYKADITISYNNADYTKSYKLELGLAEADKDKYTAYTNYVYQLDPVWIKVGKGQWVDEMFWAWTEVTIEKHKDKPLYRIKSPYTREWLEGDLMDYWADYDANYSFGVNTQPEYLEFTLHEDGRVTWEEPILVNLSYKGVDIEGYYPSQLDSGYAEEDEKSCAQFGDNGEIEVFTIVPYWYSKNINWGTYYWLYLGFPGVDITSKLDY